LLNNTSNNVTKRRLKMKKAVTIVGIVFLVAALAMPAFAHGRGWSKGRGMGIGPSDRSTTCWENLPNLTEEQSAKLKELRGQHKKEVLPLKNELISKRAEFRNLWLQDNLDEATIKAKQQEISELRNTLQEKRTQYRLEFHKILTPEQRDQLQTLRQGKKGCGYGTKTSGARGQGRMRTW
jgi:Spy/CpxP family protein refolding chaperone